MAILATLVVPLFFVTFCSQTFEKQKDEEEFVNTDKILAEFQTVGLLHNQVMAEVITDFKNSEEPFQDRGDFFRFLEKSLVSNLASKAFLRGMSEDDIRRVVVREMNLVESFYGDNNAKRGENSGSLLEFTVSSYYDHLNFRQREILSNIDWIIATAGSTQEIINGLQNINNSSAVQNLDYEDRFVIYAATSIGIESAFYWEAHFGIWVNVLTGNEPIAFKTVSDAGFFDSAQWFDGRRMINTDIASGISGAVIGCLAGSVVGGVGCVPGATAAGLTAAASASTADAMLQVLNYYF